MNERMKHMLMHTTQLEGSTQLVQVLKLSLNTTEVDVRAGNNNKYIYFLQDKEENEETEQRV